MIIFCIVKKNFEFLDDGIDIPFYNDIPKLSGAEWLLLLTSVLLIVSYITVIPIPSDYLPVAIFLTGIIPTLYRSYCGDDNFRFGSL